jgi:hypothetical protein
MIVIPLIFWETLLKRFTADQTNKERVAYFDGVPLGDVGVVTTITVPKAERHSNFFRVSAENMSAAGKHLAKHNLRRLAQVHSHGTLCVDHSKVDDERAYSQRLGSLSLVVPRHGKGVRRLNECGVHMRRETGWFRLSDEDIPTVIALVPSSIILP